MLLRKCLNTLIALCGTVVILAAGCSKEKAPEQQAPPPKKLVADRFPKSNPLAGLTPQIIDTLRAKKRIYAVSRDEYWDDRGGVLANKHFEVWYPPGRVSVTHGMYLLEEGEFARRRFQRTFGSVPEGRLHCITPLDLTTYLQRTGREWWYYSQIRDDTLIFQPIYVLVKRGLASIAVSHEYNQWAIRKISKGKAPRWLEEGLASYISDEKKVLVEQIGEFKEMKLEMTPKEVESILKEEKKRETARIAYYHAFKMTETLIDEYGMEKLAEFVKAIGDSDNPRNASKEVFGKSYEELMKIASDYAIERKE